MRSWPAPKSDPEIALSPAQRRFIEELKALHSAKLPEGIGELEKLAQAVVEALARYKLDR
jgi:hypothetical protein